jgi:hypothetical protein
MMFSFDLQKMRVYANSTIANDARTGDEGSTIGGEPHDGLGDFFGLSDAAHRMLVDGTGLVLWKALEVSGECGCLEPPPARPN